MGATYPNQSLFRFVLTHPDMDHMRGLKRLHDTVGFTNFWDTKHTKTIPSFRSDADREDWEFYQSMRSGNGPVSPRFYHANDENFAFAREENGARGGDGIEILSPTSELVTHCNERETSNDLSFILRVNYAGRSIVLCGDAEETAHAHLHARYGARLKSDFLRASHHGRDSGHHGDSLAAIAPTSVIVSVGRKPPTDASRKYHAACGHVLSTRYYGDIELRVHPNGSYEWFVQRNADR
jgi:beta-lactamase superfamily II metal-dependent hydrolase